jgi:hypothetical protein
MSDYIESLKTIIDLPKTSIEVFEKTQVEEIYNSLLKVFGSELSSDEENCLSDIANTVVAIKNDQIEKDIPLIITSEIIFNKFKYIKKTYGLSLLLLDDYIKQFEGPEEELEN